MTRRARLVRLLVVLGALGSLVAFGNGRGPARAAEASVSEVGWWSRTPPATTTADGFQVAKGPDGDTSVAAVRVAIDGTLTQAVLILSETTNGFLQESAVIHACPTVAAWTKVAAGPLDDAPEADCTRKVALERNPTTGAWTVDLLSFIEPGATSVSVVLRPGAVTAVVAPTPPTIPSAGVPLPVPGAPAPPAASAPTPVDPGFSVEFGQAAVFAGGPSGPDEAPSSSGPSSSSSGTGTIASSGDTTTFAPTFGVTDSFAFTQPATVTPSRDVLPAASPSVGVSGAGGVGSAASVESGLQPVAATRGPGAPWGRLLLLVPLSFAIGAAGSAARRTLLGRAPTPTA